MKNSGDVVVSVSEIDEAKNQGGDNARLENRASCTCNYTDEKSVCLRIDIVEAPQPLHIVFRWNSESKKATVAIGCNSSNTVSHFCWRSWKDGAMGRICGQSEWRSTRLRNTKEVMQREVIMPAENASSGDVSRLEIGIGAWRTWFSLPAQRTEYTSDKVSNSNDVKKENDNTASEVDCECMCEARVLFLEGKARLSSGHDKEALERFRSCVINYGHCLALEHCVNVVMDELPLNKELFGNLLSIMFRAMERLSQDNHESTCQCFEQYDVEKLIELFEKVYDKSLDKTALRYLCRALVLRSLEIGDVDERCVEAFESLLMSKYSDGFDREISHIFLGLCYFRKYCSLGRESDREIGAQHFVRASECTFSTRVDMAFVFEKGMLSRREYGSVNLLPNECFWFRPRRSNLKDLQDFFLWGSGFNFQLLPKTKAAFSIYAKIVSHIPEGADYLHPVEKRAMNRLAMMHHRGADDIPQDLLLAEASTKELLGKIMTFQKIILISRTVTTKCIELMRCATLPYFTDNESESEKALESLSNS